MSWVPWAAAGVGAVVVIGGAALLRRRAEADAPSGPPVDNCEKLRAIGGEQAVTACKAAKGALGVLGAIADAIPDYEATNVKLNGPVVERVPPAVWDLIKVTKSAGMGVGDTFRPLWTSAIRYKNGFVPIPDHPDWAKGAPGSKSNVNADYFREYGGGRSPSSLLSGDSQRDVYTFKWPTALAWAGAAGAGERWVVAAKYVLCPVGTTVNSGRDHRTTPGPICAAPVPTRDAPPIVQSGTSPSTGGVRVPYRGDPPR